MAGMCQLSFSFAGGRAVWQVAVVVLRAMGVHISGARSNVHSYYSITGCLLVSIMFHVQP